ncbi:MAG: transglycosylase domain-containing protein, partial [Oscillospiraceae bacterium]|nr:transglycosylase domain-containing protein [Oscillospiraceae bacterium]
MMEENKMQSGQPEQPLSPTEELDQLLGGLRADSEALLARGSELAESTDTQFDAVVDEYGRIAGLLPEEEADAAALPETLAAAEAAEEVKPEEKSKKGNNKLKEMLGRMKKGDKKAAKAAAASAEEKKGGAKNKKNANGKRPFWQKFVRFCIVCVCLGIIAGCAAGVAAVLYLVDVTADDNKILNIDQIKLSFATRLMAYNEETGEWYEYERLYSGENRIWIEYGDMPQHLIDAIVSSEDKRFYEHHGVDWRRTIFSFVNEYIYKTRDTQGGSTLTQQLIKNVTNEKAVSGFDGALRKLREIYRALEMEKNYSKEQILEAYLNTFRLSGQVAGIESAANYYFGKSTDELSVAECAAIIVVTKAPTAYNPYTNPEENKI